MGIGASVPLLLCFTPGEYECCAILVSGQELISIVQAAIAGIIQPAVTDAECAIRCAMLLVVGWYDELLIPVVCAIGVDIGRNFAFWNTAPVIYGDPAAVCPVNRYFQVALLCCTVPYALKLPQGRLAKAASGKEHDGQ